MPATESKLHIVCDPDAPCAPGEHKHRCECGLCWKHDADEFDGSDDFDNAHTCPGCGSDVRRKFYGKGEELEGEIADLLGLLLDNKMKRLRSKRKAKACPDF